MSPTFRNSFQIQQFMEQQAHQALLEVATSVLERWRNLVKERVYQQGRLKSNPSNNIYQRTYELVDSLSLKWNNPLEVELYYDTDKINPSANDGSWNSHMSFTGEDYSNLIPLFVEFGQGSWVHSYDGIDAYKDIVSFLNSSYNLILREALVKRGLVIK